MKKLVVMLSIVFVVGLIFLSCTSTNNSSMSYDKYQKLEWAEKIKVLNKIEITSNDVAEVIKKTGNTPSPDEESYKTYYQPVSDEDLIKTEVMLHSTNTFWQYIESKGYNKTNVEVLKGEEVSGFVGENFLKDLGKNIGHYLDRKFDKDYEFLAGFFFVDKDTNFYLFFSGGHHGNIYAEDSYLVKYDRKKQFQWTVCVTSNSISSAYPGYFLWEHTDIDENGHIYCSGSKGVKEYNKDGKFVKKGILKDGYYINSKGEKISKKTLWGRGWEEEYKLTWDYISCGDNSYKKYGQDIHLPEMSAFKYLIDEQLYHSYVYDLYNGTGIDYFVDKYGTLYRVFQNQGIGAARSFSSDFPIPNTFGYIFIVSPVEKGGKLLGVVPLPTPLYNISINGDVYVSVGKFDDLGLFRFKKLIKYRIYGK